MLAAVPSFFFFFFQAEDGIRDIGVNGVQTCALPISDAIGVRIRAADEDIDIDRRRRASQESRHAFGLVARIRAPQRDDRAPNRVIDLAWSRSMGRSEEHTSELQSRQYLVCRLLLEKK